MSVTLIVPAALRDLSGGRARLELGPAEVETVADALGRLRESAPGVYHRIVTEAGEVRPHVNVFVGADDIRWMCGRDRLPEVLGQPRERLLAELGALPSLREP